MAEIISNSVAEKTEWRCMGRSMEPARRQAGMDAAVGGGAAGLEGEGSMKFACGFA
jgi:hypothetical protein